MWQAEHTLETSASPEALWRCLAEVEDWPRWEEGLDSAKLQGPLAPGSVISVKQRGGRRWNYRLTRVESGSLLEGIRKGMMLEVQVMHRLEPSPLGARVTRRITVTGLLAGVAHLAWGRRFRTEVAESARKLAREAARS